MIKKNLNSDRNFVSEIDRFLADFDKRHPEKSVSQEKEIEQYQVLMMKRDTKTHSYS
jgi:hypothetical protein